MPPIIVAGLSWSDTEYVADQMWIQGFDIESSKLVPAELDQFVSRGGLLLWVQADTAARLQVANRHQLGAQVTEDELRVERNAMFNDWRIMVLDGQPHPGYALKLAHIIVCHDGDRKRLRLQLRRLRQWLRTEPQFTSRQTQSQPPRSLEPVAGQYLWEVRQFGLAVPPPRGHQQYTGLDPGRRRRSP